jgi:hypothetical protein
VILLQLFSVWWSCSWYVVLWYLIYLFCFKQDLGACGPTIEVIQDTCMTLILLLHVHYVSFLTVILVNCHTAFTFNFWPDIFYRKLWINSGCTLYAFLCCVSVAYLMWSNCKSYCISFSALIYQLTNKPGHIKSDTVLPSIYELIHDMLRFLNLNQICIYCADQRQSINF